MSQSPFEHAGSLCIGTVDFVSPGEIRVALDIEAPESVALNAGGPRPFPRVNNYLLMPVDDGYLVGQIEWITVERSAFPKRRGMKDFGLIDLPYPLRKMSLNPLGTLRRKINGSEYEGSYTFRRGTDSLPSIGASVLLPTEIQLRSIIESGENRRVQIGTSPLAGNARVCVDPDRLFGRHLAVLGNTGSGKSCSVAGLIRWSLEQAKAHGGINPNARFIVLDPNGEYSRAFSDDQPPLKARIFKVHAEDNEIPLKVPIWLWNSAEWCSFTQASTQTQRPLLKRALRDIKSGRPSTEGSSEEEKKLRLRIYVSSTIISIENDLRFGTIRTDQNKFGNRLKVIADDLERKIPDYPTHEIEAILSAIGEALKSTYKSYKKPTGELVEYYNPFTEAQVEPIVKAMKNSLTTLGGILYPEGPDEDAPIPFRGTDFADHIQILAEQGRASQFSDFLVMRIRTLLSNTLIKSIVGESESINLEGWLKNYLGCEDECSSRIAVVDLSLVPTEVIHVVTAVIARMVFEALQRYRRLNKITLPTVLVMEEAHIFVKRYNTDAENHDTATVCCQVFERIAREGRKFGLGLILSSQRPSELSPTVLSQCNSFLLHRISNDRDQELVHRLVPDNLRGLLRELPSLPSQYAILLGWASELPILVKMNDLPTSQQPSSDDPDFWNVWIGKDGDGETVERNVDCKRVADDWQKVDRHNSERDEG